MTEKECIYKGRKCDRYFYWTGNGTKACRQFNPETEMCEKDLTRKERKAQLDDLKRRGIRIIGREESK